MKLYSKTTCVLYCGIFATLLFLLPNIANALEPGKVYSGRSHTPGGRGDYINYYLEIEKIDGNHITALYDYEYRNDYYGTVSQAGKIRLKGTYDIKTGTIVFDKRIVTKQINKKGRIYREHCGLDTPLLCNVTSDGYTIVINDSKKSVISHPRFNKWQKERDFINDGHTSFARLMPATANSHSYYAAYMNELQQKEAARKAEEAKEAEKKKHEYPYPPPKEIVSYKQIDTLLSSAAYNHKTVGLKIIFAGCLWLPEVYHAEGDMNAFTLWARFYDIKPTADGYRMSGIGEITYERKPEQRRIETGAAGLDTILEIFQGETISKYRMQKTMQKIVIRDVEIKNRELYIDNQNIVLLRPRIYSSLFPEFPTCVFDLNPPTESKFPLLETTRKSCAVNKVVFENSPSWFGGEDVMAKKLAEIKDKDITMYVTPIAAFKQLEKRAALESEPAWIFENSQHPVDISQRRNMKETIHDFKKAGAKFIAQMPQLDDAERVLLFTVDYPPFTRALVSFRRPAPNKNFEMFAVVLDKDCSNLTRIADSEFVRSLGVDSDIADQDLCYGSHSKLTDRLVARYGPLPDFKVRSSENHPAGLPASAYIQNMQHLQWYRNNGDVVIQRIVITNYDKMKMSSNTIKTPKYDKNGVKLLHLWNTMTQTIVTGVRMRSATVYFRCSAFGGNISTAKLHSKFFKELTNNWDPIISKFIADPSIIESL